jgi:hypothetical protein
VSASTFAAPDGETHEPENEENGGGDPEKMKGEAEPGNQENDQKDKQNQHEFSFLDIGVIPAHDISTIIIDNRPVTMKPTAEHPDQGQDRAHRADDHQYDADRLNVESVLIRTFGEGEIKDGPNCECDNTCYQGTGHHALSLFVVGHGCTRASICINVRVRSRSQSRRRVPSEQLANERRKSERRPAPMGPQRSEPNQGYR